MDLLQTELARLRRDANLTKSIEDVDRIIEQLCKAKETIVAGTEIDLRTSIFLTNVPIDSNAASITLAKLQNPLKQSCDKVNEDLKKVHQGQSKYGKALDKVLKIEELWNVHND